MYYTKVRSPKPQSVKRCGFLFFWLISLNSLMSCTEKLYIISPITRSLVDKVGSVTFPSIGE